jgi:hypothetical protein
MSAVRKLRNFLFRKRRDCRVCTPDCLKWSHADCERWGWCKECKEEGFVSNFKNWTSGNHKIDAIIQDTQKEAPYGRGYLQWIDPQQITNIKHVGDNGCASFYQATWINAPERFIFHIAEGEVALKMTTGDINTFLDEVNKRRIRISINVY